jgi:predicted  nucleic acid-binding Zn-ribbon protein
MRERPTCRKCGNQHWRFVACEKADARNAIEERNNTVSRINATPVWRSGTPWNGDRLISLDVTPGTNTFWRKPVPDDDPKAA